MGAVATTRRTGYFALLRVHPLFLGFGFAMTLFSSFGQTYFISTFKDAISAEFTLTAEEWGLRYAIATGSAAIAFAWVGRFIDDWDLRRWTAGVVFLLAVACALMAWTPTAAVLVAGLFAIRLTGQALMGHTASASMARYFDAERGRALTISGLGFALGFSIAPPIAVLVQGAMPWRDAWLLMAGVVLVGVLPLSLFLLRGHGARHEDWRARRLGQAATDVFDEVRRVRQWTRGDVLRDWRFYLLLPGALACAFLMTGTIMFHSDLERAKVWQADYLAERMWTLGVALYVTSVLLGPLVDRFGARRLVVFTQVPLAIGMFALGTWEHEAAAYVYLLCAGMTMGSMGPVVGSLWAELYGTKYIGSVRSLVGSCMQVSTAAAPFLFGFLLDRGVTMQQITFGGFVYVVIATLLIIPAMRVRPEPAA